MEGEDSATTRLRLAIGEALECGGLTPLSIRAERAHALWLRQRRATFLRCSPRGPLRGKLERRRAAALHRRRALGSLPSSLKSTDIWRFEDVLPEQFRGVVDQGLHEVRTGEALDGVLSRLPHGAAQVAVQGVPQGPQSAVLRRECPAVPRTRPRAQGRGPRAGTRAVPAAAPPPSRTASDARAGTRARAGAAPALRRALSPPRDRPRGLAGPGEAGLHRGGRPVCGLREPGRRAASSRLQQSVLGGAVVPPVPHAASLRRVAGGRRRAGEVSRGVSRGRGARGHGGHAPFAMQRDFRYTPR